MQEAKGCVCCCFPLPASLSLRSKREPLLRDVARRAVEPSKDEPFMQEGLCGFDTLQPVHGS